MQFAGQRTTLDLVPIGDPDDILIQLTPDILPDADAVLLTGITPQQTRSDGISEAEFAAYFEKHISTPGTVFLGFNTIRFDDEFVRALLYRNLRDPYEWQWRDNRSRWDLLDLVRMTRALRPDGIQWPFGSDGSKANRLELIASVNGLTHERAHNAMSDVLASIEVAKLVRSNQPKLFDYLLDMRSKKAVEGLLNSGSPLVYTSGRYPSKYEKTAVVIPIGPGPDSGSTLVYDIRIDPSKWLKEQSEEYCPIKLVKHNRCPALAPVTVLDSKNYEMLEYTPEEITQRVRKIRQVVDALLATYRPRERPASPTSLFEVPLLEVDAMIYDGFFGDKDKKILERIHSMKPEELVDTSFEFDDMRLPALYFLYRARQFPKTLLADERVRWEEYVSHRLLGEDGSGGPYKKYMQRLQELASVDYLDADKRYILEELALYGQSIVPES
jgi:exodeoxyribonuclease-1